MIKILTQRFRSLREDAGIALPVVVGVGLVMLLLVAGSLSTVTGGVKASNQDENVKGALDAAYAGVEEYQSRLANDSTYYKFGNPAAVFSSTSTLSLPTGTNTNAAFDTAPGGTWAYVPDPTKTDGSPSQASFRYAVDTSAYGSQGVIRLLSTGRVGNTTQSIVANLKQTGFIDFLYFTDYETTDPIFSATYRNQIDTATGKNVCEFHLWETPTRPSGCGTIQFGAADTLGGPVHSNDTMTICGSTFTGTVTTSSTSTPNFIKPSGCSNGTYAVGTGPVFQKSLDMPQTNSQMKSETRTDLPADVPNPGCLYTGPTTITFTSDGNMNVVSPYTLKTETAADNSGTTPTKCGSIAALHSTAGATIPTLNQNLIFVQSVPTVSSDPNYWASNKDPGQVIAGIPTATGFTCLTSSSGGRYSGGFKFGSIQHPMTNEVLPASSTTDTPAYSCRNGDLYVSGTVKGQTTLAADNYVYVTSDIKYSDVANDVLGLVGQNAVWVYNPIQCTGFNNSGTTCNDWAYGVSGSNREIDAAILSVAHTFQVQNYDGGTSDLGGRGTLTVLGAIAQKFRGTVATTSGSSIATGYAKNYKYDTRYRYTAPPKFLTPVSTTYGVTQYAGIKPAYKADGTPVP